MKQDRKAFTESLKIPQLMRDEEWELVNGDEMENPTQIAGEMEFEASCAAGQCTALPETNLMRVKVSCAVFTVNYCSKTISMFYF